MKVPEKLYYTKDHEWLKFDPETNTALVGITDFAQRELGDIVYVEIETEGDRLVKDEVFGSVEAVKTVSDLFVPVSCEILEVNEGLEQMPENVNSAPYTDGWMIKISIENKDELNELLNANEYRDLIDA
jgi:glycine cleavage system H protein